MADSYLITIKFAADASATKQTEKKLNSVFDRVTKRFKSGLGKVASGFKTGLKLTSMAGALATVLSRILAPLSELNDKINATLSRARDIKQNAAAYGTSVEELTALQGYAAGSGISAEALNAAMAKMQVLIGQAASGEENILSNYAGATNMAKAFYNIMNQLANETDNTKRAAMASEIFGARAITQLNPLISGGMGKDFKDFIKQANLKGYAGAVNTLAERENQQSKLAFLTDINDTIAKSKIITADTLEKQNKNRQAALNRENANLSNYDNLASMDTSIQQILQQITSVVTFISTKLMPFVEKSFNGLEMLFQAVSTVKEDLPYIKKMFTDMFNKLPSWLGGKKG